MRLCSLQSMNYSSKGSPFPLLNWTLIITEYMYNGYVVFFIHFGEPLMIDGENIIIVCKSIENTVMHFSDR